MSSSAPILVDRLAPSEAISRCDRIVLCLVASLHAVALIVMAATETDLLGKAAFLLVWAVLNFLWLALVRRPTVAALISLELVVALTLLSRFKYDKLWMTVDFVDLLIIDRDTSAFLLAAFPSLRGWIGLAGTASAALLIAAWRLDRYRVGMLTSLSGASLCLAALAGLSLSFPTDLHEDFIGQNYVSKFARTGVEAIHEFADHGLLESDASVSGSLNGAPEPGRTAAVDVEDERGAKADLELRLIGPHLQGLAGATALEHLAGLAVEQEDPPAVILGIAPALPGVLEPLLPPLPRLVARSLGIRIAHLPEALDERLAIRRGLE